MTNRLNQGLGLSRLACKLLGAATAAAMLITPFTTASAEPAVKLATVESLHGRGVPSNVPNDYVITPNGYFHRECVHEVESGAKVLADGSIRHADGTQTSYGLCAHPRFTKSGERIEAGAALMPTQKPMISTNASTDAISWDWVAYSGTNASTTPAVGYLSASWKVPSDPTAADGQTVYFFPGTQLNTIIQPVLGWNADGGNSWTISSWNCCVDGQTNYSSLVPTAAGHLINGYMKGTNCSGGTCNDWEIATDDLTTGQGTTLNANPGQQFNWTFGGVMEVYSINACNEYPANGSISFIDFKVFDTKMKVFKPTFRTTVAPDTPNCNYKVNANATTTTISWQP